METYIIKSIKEDWDKTEAALTENQHRRNRDIIREIMNTVKIFTNKINKEFKDLNDEEDG